jgi:hypothetical protein
MASEKLLKAQAGLQTAFGTGVAPTIQVPWVVDYEDTREHHEAEWDAGTWTPTTITTLAATGATVSISGTAFFELLPVLLSSGLEDVAPGGADPFTYAYTISPAAPAVPKPLTWLVGAVGENIGGTGPAVKFIDQYLRSLTLSANVNDKMLALEAEMFGTSYDDNAGAGYAFAVAALPTPIEAMNGLKGQLNIQDAAAIGGDFTTMTAFACSWLDWSLALTTGIEPKYCLSDNITSFAGIKQTVPVLELAATVRTSATNYALIKAKADARTYQELQLIINGSATRKFQANLTGRWVDVLSAHSRQDGEVVMKGTFRAETPHTQTTTPHYAALSLITKTSWT